MLSGQKIRPICFPDIPTPKHGETAAARANNQDVLHKVGLESIRAGYALISRFQRHTARPEIPNMSAPSSNGIPTDTHGKLQEDYPPFQLGDSPIDDYPPFKVVVIGAGVSGIHAGIRSVLLRGFFDAWS